MRRESAGKASARRSSRVAASCLLASLRGGLAGALRCLACALELASAALERRSISETCSRSSSAAVVDNLHEAFGLR